MVNVRKMAFFDTNSTSATSPVMPIKSDGDIIVLQVKDAGSFTLQAIADSEINDWANIAAVSLKDYSVVETIEDDGIYIVNVAGLISVRAEADSGVGSMVVYATLCR